MSCLTENSYSPCSMRPAREADRKHEVAGVKVGRASKRWWERRQLLISSHERFAAQEQGSVHHNLVSAIAFGRVQVAVCTTKQGLDCIVRHDLCHTD